MIRFNNWFSDGDMRDEREKRILKTIQEDDVDSLKAILTAPAGCRLGFQDTPILSVAVWKGDLSMIKHLIDSGCDPREIDTNGRSALYMLLIMPRNASSDDEKRQLDIAEILLATYSNPVETVFLDANENEKTLFLSACFFGCDAIILRFLALLGTNAISMDDVIDNDGDNLFHRLLSDFRVPLARVDTVRALIDKFPWANQLIDAKNHDGKTPLYQLLIYSDYGGRAVIDLVNLFFQHGASPVTQDQNGTTYLDWAVWSGDASLVETLLRAGCRTYIFRDNSPLSRLLKGNVRSSDSQSIRVIELLLAFGYDLQKHLFLYTVNERPIEFASPDYAQVRDTSRMNPDILEALQELRRSNKMLSLRRQCRNTIRRHLKVEADEVIGKLTCIPDRIKSFLLVQDERPVLEI